MITWPAILILILLTGCTGRAGVPDTPAPTLTPDAIQGMAAEFRRLRTVVGHFDGGDWNDDVDRWMGKKHALMIELGERLGAGAYSRAQAVDLLGAPDAIAQEGDALYDQIRNRGEFKGPADGGADVPRNVGLHPYEFLVYHWRGEHDFLYLIAREEAILGAGWWYAGE
jgi:hypothetical protein